MMPATPPGEEIVVLDATFVVIPGNVAGFALDLPAGWLAIDARLVDTHEPRPVVLTLLGYGGFDPPAKLDVPVGRDGWSGSLVLAGGVYSCNLAVSAPVGSPTGDDDAPTELPPHTQRVALRMRLRPE